MMETLVGDPELMALLVKDNMTSGNLLAPAGGGDGAA